MTRKFLPSLPLGARTALSCLQSAMQSFHRHPHPHPHLHFCFQQRTVLQRPFRLPLYLLPEPKFDVLNSRFCSSSPVIPVRGTTTEGEGSILTAYGRTEQGGITKQPHMTVAVDIDEVLGSFLTALNTFVAEQYFLDHTLSEFHVYDFTQIWRCSRAEADLRVHAFFKSKHFDVGIAPIPGAYESLLKLVPYCELYIVTSRQNIIKDKTVAWIERHYSGIFKGVHFGNHYALDGESRSKSEICRNVGAEVLIDDNPDYAMDCAQNGIHVLLFDYNNSYPWSKTVDVPPHPLITKVHSWEEVVQALQAKPRKAKD